LLIPSTSSDEIRTPAASLYTGQALADQGKTLAPPAPARYHVTVVTHGDRRWLLLVDKVLPEPTAGRVAGWRKPKRLG
jgi:hypothetical protein